MTGLIWLAMIALYMGLVLILRGKGSRRRLGLTDAATIDLDRRTLYSAKLGLSGRPDRLFRDGEFVIPEEWKSSLRVYDSHRAQVAVYFALVEEEYGVRPPYGIIRTGDEKLHRIENTDELRGWVLDVADQIRAAGRELRREIPVSQPPGKCRACGVRKRCGQRAE